MWSPICKSTQMKTNRRQIGHETESTLACFTKPAKCMTLSVLKTNQGRIQDPPKEGARNLQQGVLTYKICQIFPNNCMKLRKFWSVGGTPEPILTCSLWKADSLKESCGYLTEKPSGINHSIFFHNSRLIRRIKQTNIYKKFRDLTRDWT